MLERSIGAPRHGERQRGLARAGWPPEQGRRQPVGLDQSSQRFARSDEVVLADDVIDGARPQPRCERRSGATLLLGGHGEEIVVHRVDSQRECGAIGGEAELHHVGKQPGRLRPLPGDELDLVGRRDHVVGPGTEEEPALRLTQALAGATHVLGELVHEPLGVFVDQFDVSVGEAGLLPQFPPCRCRRTFTDVDAALRKLPRTWHIAALEHEELAREFTTAATTPARKLELAIGGG